MANKGKGGTKADEPKSEAEKQVSQELQEQAHHMRHMAQEAGAAGGKASIFRREVVNGRPTTGGDKFLETVPTRQIWDSVYEYLSETFGGGFYRVCLKDENGDFVSGCGRLYYDIDGPPKVPAAVTEETRKLDELEKRIAEMTEKGSNASPPDMMRMLLEVTREQLRELRNPPAAAVSANPLEMAAALVGSLQASQAPLLTALIERASQPAPDMMAQMKGMAEMMLTLRELTGGNGNGGGWATVADRLADPLGKLVEQHVSNQAAGTAPPSTMGQPTMTNPPNQVQGSQPPQGPPWLQMMAPYLPQLLRYAKLGRDPNVIADFVAEELPAQHLGLIYQTLSDPSFPDTFVQHVPPAGEHVEWFTEFFGRVLEWIEPPESSSSPAEPAKPAKPEVGTVAGGGEPA